MNFAMSSLLCLSLICMFETPGLPFFVHVTALIQVKNSDRVEVVTNLKGTTIICTNESPDMYSSIDSAAHALHRKLKKYKERRRDGWHGGAAMSEDFLAALDAAIDEEEETVVATVEEDEGEEDEGEQDEEDRPLKTPPKPTRTSPRKRGKDPTKARESSTKRPRRSGKAVVEVPSPP